MFDFKANGDTKMSYNQYKSWIIKIGLCKNLRYSPYIIFKQKYFRT